MNETELLDTRTSLHTIRGWFFPSDVAMFRWLLERQRVQGQTGGLVELGAYLGKSTVVIGDYVRDDEQFVVVDLFDSDAPDSDNAHEMDMSYSTLTRDAFEANFRRFHPKLPSVFTAPSSHVRELVEPGTVRFMHVDASHLYEHVAIDVDSARALLQPQGIVAFDDFRSEHTPGVSAAVWEAVLNKGLKPLMVTESKLYGTWSDGDALQEELMAWLEGDELGWGEYQQVAGHRLIRGKIREATPAKPVGSGTPQDVPRQADPARSREVRPPQGRSPQAPGAMRRLARDWVPPKVLRAARRAGRRRQG